MSNEKTDANASGENQAVSIAGGSLFLIGLMLWFFTSGTKNDIHTLRQEVREMKATLDSLSKDVKTLRPDGENRGLTDNKDRGEVTATTFEVEPATVH